jgi:hypothetical protein
MKKTMMMLLAVSLVFALALPAMAETAVEFSGRYFVRGTMMDNAWMSDDSNAQDTYEDHRARKGKTGENRWRKAMGLKFNDQG